MHTSIRLVAALGAGLAVGLAVMAHDRQIEAEWAVSPGQVADAQAYGKPGVELTPGHFAVRPVPSEEAGRLPVKWVLLGIAAACVVLAGTGRRRTPPKA